MLLSQTPGNLPKRTIGPTLIAQLVPKLYPALHLKHGREHANAPPPFPNAQDEDDRRKCEEKDIIKIPREKGKVILAHFLIGSLAALFTKPPLRPQLNLKTTKKKR
ncbi:hypothetical protein TNIN_365691 [Trichonephila inaurata madagascariensis]|uniref:Uncharacterized protein n=1 Tax=Trichonephila inaurata madagascariensis TaxID=2747483 RepID=A0A8X7C0D5_9ARAC|nr:hypothetical protein TNIN_365691 [Trichonephila inaurata madagascariensis]